MVVKCWLIPLVVTFTVAFLLFNKEKKSNLDAKANNTFEEVKTKVKKNYILQNIEIS